MEITWRAIGREEERGENGGKGTGNKKPNKYAQNKQGEVKNSIGNGEATELTYTTNGHELNVSGGECWRVGGAGRRGIKGITKLEKF